MRLKRAWGGDTLGAKLKGAAGRPSGFDYLRLLLAIAVVAAHAQLTVAGAAANARLWDSPLQPLIRSVLPMFFALSGFLVGGSLERCRTLLSFLGFRVIRIYPALTVEVLLSAFFVGTATTSHKLGSYFADPQFHQYLLNALGDIHYRLPGVFDTLPFPHIVNRQLWTVPYELACYIILGVLALCGVVRRRSLAVMAAVGVAVFHLAVRLLRHHGELPSNDGTVSGLLLAVSFLAGLSLYLYRDRVPYSPALGGLAAVLALPLISVVPFGDAPAMFLLAYVTMCLGLANPRRIAVIRAADLSYGVYLYGFVIQQLYALLLPGLRIWWLNILVCVPCALIFAGLSWTLIEKPALKLKAQVLWLEAMLTTRRPFWRPTNTAHVHPQPR